MSIPAMDSLRHERVGLATSEDDSVSMVLQSYFRTGESAKRGASDPIEAMARPFPLMMNANEPTVVESFINDATVEPFSDALVEYAALLYKSMEAGEWVDEFEEYDTSRLTGVEETLAGSLQHFATRDLPRTLQRTVFRKAAQVYDQFDDVESLVSNPLRDIEGRDSYGFEYLPKMSEVDSWTLTHSEYTSRVDSWEDTHTNQDGEQKRVASSLWLRYEVNGSTEERPIVSFQNELAGFSAASPMVEFGEDMLEEVSTEVVEGILSGEDTSDPLTPVESSQLDGTRTEAYLTEFVSES